MVDPVPPPGLEQPKTAFRAWARGRLKALDPSTEQALSTRAAEHIAAYLEALPAGILLGYVPIRGEIDPINALSFAIKRDWAIAVPRCQSKDSTPILQALSADALSVTPDGPRWNDATLEPDAWGMLTPRLKVPVRPQAVTAVLVPGLAFDQSGHRLGRGAGVYDRLLATLPSTALRIGLVHADRVIPALPREPHDVAMHAIITPDGIVRPHA